MIAWIFLIFIWGAGPSTLAAVASTRASCNSRPILFTAAAFASLMSFSPIALMLNAAGDQSGIFLAIFYPAIEYAVLTVVSMIAITRSCRVERVYDHAPDGRSADTHPL